MNNNILNTMLNGINKSLKIADNLIPICKDTYPLIKKGKNFLNKTNHSNISTSKPNNNKNNNNQNNNTNISKKNLSNNPKFFI